MFVPGFPQPVDALDHEVKYLLPAAAAAAARALLEGVCRREAPHAASRVGTIYLDTRELGAACEKWASDYRKTKVRLRWYDGAGAVRLEVKRRLGSRREKLRLELPLDGADLERDGLDAAAAHDLRAPLARLGVEAPDALLPVLRLAYDRERFVDPASGARLSLDTRLVALERAGWCSALGIQREPGGGLDVALVECKGPERALPAALAGLAALGARRRSFSKYTACLEYGFN